MKKDLWAFGPLGSVSPFVVHHPADDCGGGTHKIGCPALIGDHPPHTSRADCSFPIQALCWHLLVFLLQTHALSDFLQGLLLACNSFPYLCCRGHQAGYIGGVEWRWRCRGIHRVVSPLTLLSPLG
jgi:hypothetical protein